MSEFARLWPEADKGKSREGTERVTEQTEGSAEGWRVRKGGTDGKGTIVLTFCLAHSPSVCFAFSLFVMH